MTNQQTHNHNTQTRTEMMREIEERREQKTKATLARYLNTIMYVVAVVYPFVGMVWGTIMLLNKNLSFRINGAYMFLAVTGGLLLWWAVWKIWGVKIVEALVPRLL